MHPFVCIPCRHHCSRSFNARTAIGRATLALPAIPAFIIASGLGVNTGIPYSTWAMRVEPQAGHLTDLCRLSYRLLATYPSPSPLVGIWA